MVAAPLHAQTSANPVSAEAVPTTSNATPLAPRADTAPNSEISPLVDANETQPPADNAEIVVTGTRLANFEAPTPVTSLTQRDLETKAARSVTDLMLDIPALRFNQNNSQVSAAIGASNLDLRGLGASRTLLLLDGRRFAATDPSGGVDVSVIPAVLISKIDIVTGGASAAYGSDAVSGVVNITLDSKFEGIKGSLQYGQTTHGDHYQPGVS
ncbi:MAG: TonB-dependent receptor plug domain-containing protein, partial [Sphingomonas sp.]